MPGDRPYNPDLLQRETAIISGDTRSPLYPDAHAADPAVRRRNEYLIANGDPTQAPDTFTHQVLHDPNFQHHPGKAGRLGRHIGRLVSFVVEPGGRKRRAQRLVETFNHRIDSIDYVGDKVEYDPRQGDLNPRKKIGWPGTEKTSSTGVTWRDESHDNLGYELLDIKNSFVPAPDTPNVNRATTAYENRSNRRFNRHWDKRRKAGEEARWQEKTYGSLVSTASTVPKSREQRKVLRRSSRAIQEGEEEAARQYSKMRRITSSRDIRGRITRWRRESARRRAA